MSRLVLDFAARPRPAQLTLLLLGVACAGVAVECQRYTRLSAQRDAAEAALRQLDTRQARRESAAAVAAVDPAVSRETQELRRALALPWERMLDDLQRAATADILLTQVQPEADGRVTINGRALASRDFTAYMARLRRSAGWQDVTPVSEVLGEPDITGKPVVFQMVATYDLH